MSRSNLVVIAFAIVALAIALIFAFVNPRRNEEIVKPPEGGTPTPAPTSGVRQTPSPGQIRTPAPTRGPISITPKPVSATPAVSPERPFGPFAGEDAIREAIFGGDPGNQELAYQVLAGLLEQGKGLEILKEMFESDNRDIQEEALVLIPNTDERYRFPFIKIGLDHPDPEYRLESLSLLRDIAEVDVSSVLDKAMLDKDPEVLEELADLFFYFIDKPIYGPVERGLQHENEEVREEAFSYLEDTHTPESAEILMKVLEYEDAEMIERAGDALRFMLDADIETNGVTEWKQWWAENKERWIKEEAFEMDDWDIKPDNI